jgi:hypothetical protein
MGHDNDKRALAYYDTAIITAVKSFIVQAPGNGNGEKNLDYKLHFQDVIFRLG